MARAPDVQEFPDGRKPSRVQRRLRGNRPHVGLPRLAAFQRERSRVLCPVKTGPGPARVEIYSKLRRREDCRDRRDCFENSTDKGRRLAWLVEPPVRFGVTGNSDKHPQGQDSVGSSLRRILVMRPWTWSSIRE